MTKIYRSRSGQITAIDTKTQLTTLGSETAPGKLDVPQKANKLSAIIVSFDCDIGTALGASSGLVRLEGPGLPNGPETISAGVTGGGEAITGNVGHVPGTRIEMGPNGVSIQKGEEIQIFGEALVTDLGAYEMGVTLEFQT